MQNKLPLLAFLLGGMTIIRLFWAVTDPRGRKQYIKYIFKPNNLLLSAAETITAIFLIITTLLIPSPIDKVDQGFVTVGVLLFLAGFVILIWAKLIMNKNWGPAEASHDISRQKDLVTQGPFAFTRNPIYLGIILTDLGIFIALQSFLIFLTYFHYLYYRRFIVKEEEFLEKHFGQKYLDYKEKVPRFI